MSSRALRSGASWFCRSNRKNLLENMGRLGFGKSKPRRPFSLPDIHLCHFSMAVEISLWCAAVADLDGGIVRIVVCVMLTAYASYLQIRRKPPIEDAEMRAAQRPRLWLKAPRWISRIKPCSTPRWTRVRRTRTVTWKLSFFAPTTKRAVAFWAGKLPAGISLTPACRSGCQD